MTMTYNPSWNTETQPGYPLIPGTDDPRWKQVMVRVRTHEQFTELVTFPDARYGSVILSIYSGDIVYVIKDIRHADWIAAQVGYKTGWLNVAHVAFKVVKALEESPLVQTDWMEQQQAVPQELLSSHAQSVHEETQTAQKVSSKDISRVIRYLKGFLSKN